MAHVASIGSALMRDPTSTGKHGVDPDERQNPPTKLLPSEILRSGKHYASNRGHHPRATCSYDHFEIAHVPSKSLTSDAPPEHAAVVIEVMDASLARGAVVRPRRLVPPAPAAVLEAEALQQWDLEPMLYLHHS